MRLFFPWVSMVALCAADNSFWPQWRGPFFNGVAQGQAPVSWTADKNIVWKTSIPGRGHSTPIVWGGRIFLTTATPLAAVRGSGRGRGQEVAGGADHKLQVMCLDRRTGKVIWEQTARVVTPHEGYHAGYGSFASHSPATDGKLVYASFGSRGIFVYDLDGKLVWSKSFPPANMRFGHGEGIAPVLAGDRLILSADSEDNSNITVLDKHTGKELWRQKRDEPSAWSNPLVVRFNGRDQVIVAATNKVRSYDLETGKLIWECAGLGSNVIPAPVEKDGIVFVMSGHQNQNMMAIKLGAEGDLTGTKSILWTNAKGNPYTPSPVLAGDELYLLTDTGQLSCFNAKTGEAHYKQQRLHRHYGFKASPVAANGKLYLASEDGDVVVMKMGVKFEVLATNSIPDEMFIASPVILDGAIYLRGRNAVYCVR